MNGVRMQSQLPYYDDRLYVYVTVVCLQGGPKSEMTLIVHIFAMTRLIRMICAIFAHCKKRFVPYSSRMLDVCRIKCSTAQYLITHA